MTMPVVDAQPLVAAVTTAIAAQGLAIGDGRKPAVSAGRPYAVAWFDAGVVGDRSLLSRDGFSLTAPFQLYGLTPESVRWAVKQLRAGLLSLGGQVVDGRTVHTPEHLAATSPDRDDKADPGPLWWVYDEWRIRTS